jgi:hypothetical protein
MLHQEDIMRRDLVQELTEMRKLGVKVSDYCLHQAEVLDLTDYEAISIGDLASLFCELYK